MILDFEAGVPVHPLKSYNFKLGMGKNLVRCVDSQENFLFGRHGPTDFSESQKRRHRQKKRLHDIESDPALGYATFTLFTNLVYP